MKIVKLLSLVSIVALSASGCGGKKTKTDSGAEYGPMPPTAGATTPGEATSGPVGPEAPIGPMPSPDFTPPKDGYVLVLGPGLARGLAYIGVLHELEARQVGVRAVVGVEIGAVIGGIWGSSSLNNLEWEMHKFRKQTLLDVPILGLGRKVAEGKKLYAFLDKALKVDLLQKMKVPLIVASAVRGEQTLYDSVGSAKDSIRGAMGIPGVIKPYNWEGKERVTAAIDAPFPAAKAKDLGLGKVVCVDVINRGDNYSPKDGTEEQLATLMRSVATTARAQLKECDYVLSIPTDGIGYLDFDAKADLIYRGKVAAQKWLESTQ